MVGRVAAVDMDTVVADILAEVVLAKVAVVAEADRKAVLVLVLAKYLLVAVVDLVIIGPN